MLRRARHLRRLRRMKRAARLIHRGQYKRARKQLTLALRSSDDYRVRRLLCRSHEAAGELWPAIHHLQQAIERAPARLRSSMRNRLGLLYARVGKRSRACQSFTAVLKTRPNDSRAKKYRALYCG